MKKILFLLFVFLILLACSNVTYYEDPKIAAQATVTAEAYVNQIAAELKALREENREPEKVGKTESESQGLEKIFIFILGIIAGSIIWRVKIKNSNVTELSVFGSYVDIDGGE